MSDETKDLLDNHHSSAAKASEGDGVDGNESSSDSEFCPGAPKCPRLEEDDDEEEDEESEVSDEEEVDQRDQEREGDSAKLDPGKEAYQSMDSYLHSLQQLGNKEAKTSDDTERVRTLLGRFKDLVNKHEDNGEVSNPDKLLQMFYKHKMFALQEVRNVAGFVEGLEDDSATKSEEDPTSTFVFLAPLATELWYRWDKGARQWQWTPDREHWMFCSRLTVSGGQWENEVPAPENVSIINYLNAIRPVPSDEQYLPQYDVAKILTRLREFEDDEVRKMAREIGESITKAQEKWPFQDPELRFPNLQEE